MFIDADKGNYQAYVDAVAPLMRPGGLLLVDNTLWSGRVLEPSGLARPVADDGRRPPP